VKTFLVAYDTRIFQYAVPNFISLVAMPRQKNSVHKFNTKSVAEKYVCEVGRQELILNWYILLSDFRACAPV